MRLALLLSLVVACSNEGRFKLSWELRAREVSGPTLSCDQESVVELEARPLGAEPVLRDRFPCGDLQGTSGPVPADTPFMVVVRYRSASGAVLAETAPTPERVAPDGVTDLGKVVIVRKTEPGKLVINVRWQRSEAGNDACVPTTGDRTAVVRRMEWRILDASGALVTGSPAITACSPPPSDVVGGAACRESIEAPALAHGEYRLVISGLDDACRPCWPEIELPVTHTGGVVEVMVPRDPACQASR